MAEQGCLLDHLKALLKECETELDAFPDMKLIDNAFPDMNTFSKFYAPAKVGHDQYADVGHLS